MPHYMITDCETSGMFRWKDDHGNPVAADAPGQPRLAELGLIFLSPNYEVEEKRSWLIKPEGWEMSAEAAAKTGITTELLKVEGVRIEEALALYRAGIEARRVVVGFNIMFDLKQMRAELRRAGLPDSYMQTRSLCLMWATRSIVQARGVNGAVKNPKMEEVCQFFGLAPPKHRALPDCEDNLAIMRELIGRGALPEPKSPYDKKAKPKKTKVKRDVGMSGDDPELDDAQQEIPL